MESVIMNLLAFVGILAGGYFSFIYVSKSSDNKKINLNDEIELIKNSQECMHYASEHSTYVHEMLNNIKYRKQKDELFKLIKRPEIREKAIKSVNEKRDYEKNKKLDLINKRKVGYKYEKEIFEIFDTKDCLTKQQIINGFIEKFSTNETKALEMFDECYKNWLIMPYDSKNNGLYSVGFILDADNVNLHKDDLTRKKWLILNNKQLDN